MSKISVIIPCYNHARYLGETIQSVLVQTHPADEIIIVDDGSKDDSAEVAVRYSDRYPTVRLLRQENAGRSVAANYGLHESQGDFLVFLDADDRLMPDALAVGMEQLGAHPGAALASGHCVYIDADGIPMETWPQPLVTEAYYEHLLRQNFIWNPGNVLFRRSAVEAVGGFNTKVRHSEDYDIYLRIARKSPFICHNKIVAEYRQHPNNKSKSAHTMLRTMLQILENEAAIANRLPNTRQAWRAGLQNTKQFYGERCMAQFYEHFWESGDWKRKWMMFTTLVRYHLRGSLRFLKNRLKAKISRSETLPKYI